MGRKTRCKLFLKGSNEFGEITVIYTDHLQMRNADFVDACFTGQADLIVQLPIVYFGF